MTADSLLFAFLLAGGLIVIGKIFRQKLRFLQRLFLPSSIIAGMLALLLGPQVIGRLITVEGPFANGVWPESVLRTWSMIPRELISVVFATLFLGKTMPSRGQMWMKAGPMIAHGQTMAWGQYFVGLTVVLTMLTPWVGLNPLSGALIEIGFEGGHGTAAGLRESFHEFGFADGADMALGMATFGVIFGVVLGTVLINWAIRSGHINKPDHHVDEDDLELTSTEKLEHPPERNYKDKAIEPLSIHLGLIAFSIGVGWLILQAMIQAERQFLLPLGWPELFTYIPLFPLAMVGGVIVQLGAIRLGYDHLIDRQLMNRIGGASLDLLIVAALATLSLEVLGQNALALTILVIAGLSWNLFGFLVLARFMFPRDWVPNGLANFGQGTGMTAVGLMLVRMVDPHQRTGAMEAFGYKQLLFEPFVGGGIFTAASLPLIYQFGPKPLMIVTGMIMLSWMVFGLVQSKKMKNKIQPQQPTE